MEILKFEEAEAATLPDLGEDIEVDAALWRRLESYIVYRWTPRQCVWTVTGAGVWEPHLSPVSNATVDTWDDTLHVWEAVTVNPSPIGGFVFSSCRTHRITATAGDTAEPVPALLVSAYHRLAAYHADANAGANQYSLKIGETGLDETIDRNPSYIARALQQSGCADLLRSYRRV